jgi:Xaa-Pro aminopeptidase
MTRVEEVLIKLEVIRNILQETNSSGIRLRGTDWFAWITAGGSNTVLMAAETGVAEVLVTADNAWVLTDEIEARRLQNEQLIDEAEPSLYRLHVYPWAEVSQQESFVDRVTHSGKILSDRPAHSSAESPKEFPLPQSLKRHRQIMLPSEIDRYRQVGRLASEAMTQVLNQAQPHWTEYELAGAGAKALWERGLHPALTLAAGDRRLSLYRHPLPTGEAIGKQAMLVFCARGQGLIISLTRFVCFGRLSEQDQKLHHSIAEIEAVALDRSRIETPLNEIYTALEKAYLQHGYPNAIREHHQGGTAGYGAREVVATPDTGDRLAAGMVLAWNPSIPGAKIEDTFLLHSDNHLENLSFDPQFPHTEVAGRLRAIPLERGL